MSGRSQSTYVPHETHHQAAAFVCNSIVWLDLIQSIRIAPAMVARMVIAVPAVSVLKGSVEDFSICKCLQSGVLNSLPNEEQRLGR